MIARPASLRDAWLWIGVVLYAAFYLALGAFRYAGHRNFVDLGIFAQTAASAFGCFCNPVEGGHWAFHFSPILYVAGALIHMWPSALALVALQAAAGALTAPAVYGIVARHADRRAARLSALVVLLYPPLAGAIFNDFHENGLAPAAVAWLLWAFDGGYAGWTLLFAAFTLAIKEDQALFVAIAGLIGAIAYRRDLLRWRLAVGIGVTAAVVFVVFFTVVQPHERSDFLSVTQGSGWSPARFYAWTPADWKALFPSGLVARIGFLLLAFAPLLFIPFRSRAIVVAMLPLAEVLASRMSTTYTTGSHYAGAWAGWALYAFAMSIAEIWRRSPQRAYKVLYWCVGLCVAEFAVANPLHPGYFLHGRSQAGATLDTFIAALPRDVSLATQEEAYTHLAATDPNVTVLPETPDRPVNSCFILTDEAFADSPRLVESKPLLRRLIASGEYSVTRREGTITLYKRVAVCR